MNLKNILILWLFGTRHFADNKNISMSKKELNSNINERLEQISSVCHSIKIDHDNEIDKTHMSVPDCIMTKNCSTLGYESNFHDKVHIYKNNNKLGNKLDCKQSLISKCEEVVPEPKCPMLGLLKGYTCTEVDTKPHFIQGLANGSPKFAHISNHISINMLSGLSKSLSNIYKFLTRQNKKCDNENSDTEKITNEKKKSKKCNQKKTCRNKVQRLRSKNNQQDLKITELKVKNYLINQKHSQKFSTKINPECVIQVIDKKGSNTTLGDISNCISNYNLM